jgi:hypothetical protein
MTTIINPNSQDPITRINVMRVFTYDVEEIVRTIHEDNRGDADIEVTYDDVMEYIETLVEDDFRSNGINDLIFTDQDGDHL